MIDILKTIFDIIIITKTWLGLTNRDNTRFNVQKNIMNKTVNYINQNYGYGIIVIKTNSISDVEIID